MGWVGCEWCDLCRIYKLGSVFPKSPKQWAGSKRRRSEREREAGSRLDFKLFRLLVEGEALKLEALGPFMVTIGGRGTGSVVAVATLYHLLPSRGWC